MSRSGNAESAHLDDPSAVLGSSLISTRRSSSWNSSSLLSSSSFGSPHFFLNNSSSVLRASGCGLYGSVKLSAWTLPFEVESAIRVAARSHSVGSSRIASSLLPC